jgi:hypothetical protein
MTNQQHPITPTPELVQCFLHIHPVTPTGMTYEQFIATRFAQWGADQELEACKQYMHDQDWFMSPTLRMSQLHNARRPKPPSLKEQALEALETLNQAWTMPKELDAVIAIRRALEALPND